MWDSAGFLRTVPFDSILDTEDTDAWIFNCVDIQEGETRIRSNDPRMLERLKRAFDGAIR